MPTTLGPLGSEWTRIEEQMRERQMSGIVIEIVRLSYYLGARVTNRAAKANHVSTVLMSSELREFDREVTDAAPNETAPVGVPAG